MVVRACTSAYERFVMKIFLTGQQASSALMSRSVYLRKGMKCSGLIISIISMTQPLRRAILRRRWTMPIFDWCVVISAMRPCSKSSSLSLSQTGLSISPPRAGVRPSIENPSIYQSVNLEGTVNLFERCRHDGVTTSSLHHHPPCMVIARKCHFQKRILSANPFRRTQRQSEPANCLRIPGIICLAYT